MTTTEPTGAPPPGRAPERAGNGGQPALSAAPSLSDETVVALLTAMIRARVFSQRAFNLQRQGRAGTIAPITGEEAAVVGTAFALDPSVDFVFPQYREPVALAARFGEELLDRYVLYVRGHPGGGHYPTARSHPLQIALAAQVPHAVGYAWGMRLQRQPGVVCTFFGDGASSEGDFYEAANLAGVLRVPVIFVLVNNGWAISTPTTKQTAAESFAAKAQAFGFPGVEVDGNDVLAVYEVVAAARARAAAGDGPTLVEAVTYRMGPHTTADDPTRYVPAAELERWKQRDPIQRLREVLEPRGLWDEARQQAAEAAAHLRMDQAVEWAESQAVSPQDLFAHVYAEPPARLRRQREELLAYLEAGEA